ncbi:MAG: GNAT family N-acetyltransferase [Opitutales bacterium]
MEFETPSGTAGILRDWKDADFPAFAEMNADPEVMRYLLKTLTLEEAQTFLNKIRTLIAENGWGFWAVEVDGELAGMTGLHAPTFEAPFTPCVEIGWRFRKQFWGRSIAFSAARTALSYGFEKLQLDEIVAFTTQGNIRSQTLMKRLGMTYDPRDDFDHPMVEADNPLLRHVLYRKSRLVQ